MNRVLKSLRADRIACLERHCLTILDMGRLVLLTRTTVPDFTTDIDRRKAPPSGSLHVQEAKIDPTYLAALH